MSPKKLSGGQRLKAWRQANEVTVIELAQLLGSSRQHVYDLEAGVYRPGRTQAIKLEKATGISAGDWE